MSTSLDMPIEALDAETPAAQTREEPHGQAPLARPKSWPVRLWHGLCAVLEWLFGLVSLLATLALLAAIPIMNLIALGYLLDASGRVAKSGRVRDGFVDIGKFARIGSLVAGTWICLLVPRLISSLASDAWLIDPDGFAAR